VPDLSVIIPVYNAGGFLRECLKSLCSQKLPDMEILCIDDCSTDNSAEILKEFEALDRRVRVFHQPANSGPGAARNVGIAEAKGKYLGFVDADDWTDDGYFGQMLDIAKKNNADIVINANILIETPSRRYPFSWLWYQAPKMGVEQLAPDYAAHYTPNVMIAHMFRRGTVTEHSCRCPEDYNICEDAYFHIAACMNAKCIYAFSGPAYHYRKVKSSLTDTESFYNISSVRNYLRLAEYFGDRIYESSFKLKLFDNNTFSNIKTEHEFETVKQYVTGLRRYFMESGVKLSRFDRFAIDSVLASGSQKELESRIGVDPWIRFRTMEKLRNRPNVIISVIIPAYNTAKYILDCLDSVGKQTLEDIEILCVNDGSVDNTPTLVKRFSLEDNRVTLIDLPENKGVSNARNTAMKLAVGKYVYFMDSDDSIDEGYLQELYEAMEKSGASIVINSNIIKENEDSTSSEFRRFDFIGEEGKFHKASELEPNFPPVTWVRMYKKQFLEDSGILFPDVKCGSEDIFFNYACEITEGEAFAFKGKNAYHYRQRSDSAMHKSARGFHYLESFSLLNDYLDSKGIAKDGLKLFYVESLILDTEEKFLFTKSYLERIAENIRKNAFLYNEQEKFLVSVMEECRDYDSFKRKYNGNIALSFIRSRMKNRT